MINLKDLTYEELENFIKSEGEPAFRSKQIFSWLYKGVESIDEMTNLSKSLREKLSGKSFVSAPEIRAKYLSVDGTVKYVWELSDGELIESVVMEYKHGRSICISTQAGCNMGCKFCASTVGGKRRDLTPGEIIDQIIFAQKDLDIRISNVVMMGIGEPLDNYDNVIKFLKNVGHPDGLNIGYRHISLSTCGIVDKIIKLADEKMPVTLSLSLHAPTDELRESIMPINKKYNIAQVLDACRHYIEKTGRRVSFEYTLIHGKNDTVWHANKLADLIRGMLCHVNLIPVNEARENMVRSRKAEVQKFTDTLTARGINATVRRQLGNDIKASCGQLVAKESEKK
ncbi:MAG: 23S rRNA (adenine(2503)-C(2))-methyltransferase RlmN [Clostridia bacterium]|nr:23S rRNA (adenine(2503)-C(2))-methyltransferase RlmN [Clostridia bacterium]